MEEAIEELQFNRTLEDEFSNTNSVDDVIITITIILGVVSAILTILAIAINKPMRTRTNLVLLLYMVCEICTLSSIPMYMSDLMRHVIEFKTHCFAISTNYAFQFDELLIISVLLSNTIIHSKKVSDKALIQIMCVMFVSFYILSLIWCYLDDMALHMFGLLALMEFILLVTTIAKDVYLCCSGKSGTLSEDERFRMGIVRIYIYLLFTISMVTEYFAGTQAALSYTIFSLSPMLMLIYAFLTNMRYKVCVLNLFKGRENRYKMDAMNGFVEETGNDNRNVRIDIGNK